MRHESAAAYAATAWAELTGKTGAVLTSAGPGFLAALQGVAACATMELPLLFLSGHSSVSQRGRGAFQELDQQRIVGSLCKASLSADAVEKIPGIFAAAGDLANAGVPGPVHVSLPGDVLAATGAPAGLESSPSAKSLTDRQSATLDEMARRLARARRPLILARPAATRGPAGEHLRRLAAGLSIEPVVIEAPRGMADLKYAGIGARFTESDCALVVAPPDFAIGFLAADLVATGGTVLLVDAPGDPPSGRDVELYLQADLTLALAELAGKLGESTQVEQQWAELWPLEPPPAPGASSAGQVHPLAVSSALRELIAPDDIIVLDGGEFCQWIRLGLRDLPNPVLWNGKIGAIGGAIPMAAGAAVASQDSERRVIAIMGDGAAGYHLSEFETLARYQLPVIAIVGNDARWAAEWHLQIARYGAERTFETELLQARYDRVAAGFDAHGEHVRTLEDLQGALHEAFGRLGTTCVNVEVAPVPSPAAMS
jgi:acetolactate synthase-1/2/3 large subunit